MGPRSVTGSAALGNKIKSRRNELGLTIEEAAAKAKVGTKTWSRYESGGAIRCDKAVNVCKALNWNVLPSDEDEQPGTDLSTYKNDKAWPKALAETFGEAAAASFVIGSEILLDNIQQDLDSLSKRPKGTHIGELDISWLEYSLPQQFLMRYDYEFLFNLRSIVMKFRRQASDERKFVAHTVIEEITLYMIMEESKCLMESILSQLEQNEYDRYENWEDWPFDLFGDSDVIMFLYSGEYLTEDNPYHFLHWWEEQFFVDVSASL